MTRHALVRITRRAVTGMSVMPAFSASLRGICRQHMQHQRAGLHETQVLFF